MGTFLKDNMVLKKYIWYNENVQGNERSKGGTFTGHVRASEAWLFFCSAFGIYGTADEIIVIRR